MVVIGRACFKENSSLHISSAKFRNDLSTKNIYIFLQPNFPNDLFLVIYTYECQFYIFITTLTAFHHCTFQVITAQFVHNCTLKQALATGEYARLGPYIYWCFHTDYEHIMYDRTVRVFHL